MEITQTGMPEDRIAALERRLQELEPLVSGLIAELLDLKAVTTTMTRDTVRYTADPIHQEPAASSVSYAATASDGDRNVILSGKGRQPDVAAPAEPAMVRIMQTDGTMKMEPRYGGASMINSSAGNGRNRKGAADSNRQSPLIYAASEEKTAPAKR